MAEDEMLVCRQINDQYCIGLEDGDNFILLSMDKRKENAKQEAIQVISRWMLVMSSL